MSISADEIHATLSKPKRWRGYAWRHMDECPHTELAVKLVAL